MAESIEKKLVWKYKIELKDEDFQAVRALISYELSKDFVNFIYQANGAMPSKKTIQIGDEFYSFKNILNFNLQGECTFPIFYGLLKDREMLAEDEIPFGSDGCGGYYLLNLSSQRVVFLDLQSEEKKNLVRFDLFISKIGG